MNEAEFPAKLKVFEGYADHMYLGTAGKVTIGIGVMLGSAKSAESAPLGFIDRKTREKAGNAAIEQDFERVSKAPKGMFPPSKYTSYTELVADAASLKRELDRRLQNAKSDAIAFYP